MLPIPTVAYKWIGLAIAVIAFGGACYYKGYAREHDRLVTYQAQVEQAAKDQNLAALKKDAENEAQTLAVANAYGDAYNRLLGRLHNYQNGRGQLPQTNQGSQGSDGTQQELSGTCQSSEFYANALEDALKLQAWQEWAKRMDLPVE